LYAKFPKCEFFLESTAFLGHIVSGEGIGVTLKRLRLCRTCPDPHLQLILGISRELKIHEKNYQTHDLELVVVVFALKIWYHYLYGVHVDVFTYHKSLQYVFS